MTAQLATAPAVEPGRQPGTATAAPRNRGRVGRLLLGESEDPRWARPALLGLLVVTGLLYIWDLGASGYANEFYAAAVQAGTKSLKAWFFGSLDASNFITVDKPPASLWVMALFGRLFGFSSWSLLLPQALEGVATVALLYGAVRRGLVELAGRRAAVLGGLGAGLVAAFTPAAALMFRFDNPDALLVLLMTLAGYCVVRALPRGSGLWLALAGSALGFAFLTKMLQGLLVLPAFALVYLVAANTGLVKRLLHLLLAGAALVVSAGWWVLAVALWPASARPYIGGSTNNTVLDLVFGYNGFGRLSGGSGQGGGGGGTSGSSFGGATGVQRLFSSEMGLEVSWLLPAALVALVAVIVLRRNADRTDALRTNALLWGGWLVVTGLVFSYMSGTIHPYYTVALVPAVAGLAALGVVALWRSEARLPARITVALMIALTGFWGFELLSENSDWMPALRWVSLVGSLLAALTIVFASLAERARLAGVALVIGIATSLVGTVSYSIATASTAHSGSIPTVGPGSSGGGFGGGSGGPGGSSGPGSSGSSGSSASSSSSGSSSASDASGTSSASTATSVAALLTATTTRWSAAVDGSQSAASLELSTGTAVMAIGGWSSDPTPTLAEFKADVAAGEISYYIVSGNGGGMGGSSSTASAIASWVEANFTATTVGGSTVYKLTS